MEYQINPPADKAVAKPTPHDWRSALKGVIVDAHSYGELSEFAAMALIRAFRLEAA
jgi:hypothetical protein